MGLVAKSLVVIPLGLEELTEVRLAVDVPMQGGKTPKAEQNKFGNGLRRLTKREQGPAEQASAKQKLLLNADKETKHNTAALQDSNLNGVG